MLRFNAHAPEASRPGETPSMSLVRRLFAKLQQLSCPRAKRLALWVFFSTGIAFAAKFTSNLPTESGEVQAPMETPQVRQEWDTARGDWWSAPLDLQQLSEIYGVEPANPIITIEGFNTARATFQPAEPVEAFSAQLPPPPMLPSSEELAAAPESGTVLVSGSANYSTDEHVFVGAGLSGVLTQMAYIGSSDSAASNGFVAVPEPTAVAILGLIFAGLAGMRRQARPRQNLAR